jgi:hypothetical protein
MPSASDVRERVVEFAKGLLRLDGTQCKNEAERENDEPDPPHEHLVKDGWRESSRALKRAPAKPRASVTSTRGVEGTQGSSRPGARPRSLETFPRFTRTWAGTALAQSHCEDESNLRVVRERGPA